MSRARRWVIISVLSTAVVLGLMVEAAVAYPWSVAESAPPICSNAFGTRISCDLHQDVNAVGVGVLLVLGLAVVLRRLWTARAAGVHDAMTTEGRPAAVTGRRSSAARRRGAR